jgi:hypothetical protein
MARTGFNDQESVFCGCDRFIVGIFHVLGPVPESSDSKVGINDCSDNNSNSVRRSGSIRIDDALRNFSQNIGALGCFENE